MTSRICVCLLFSRAAPRRQYRYNDIFLLLACIGKYFRMKNERDVVGPLWKNHIQQRWRWRRRLLFFFLLSLYFEIVFSFVCVIVFYSHCLCALFFFSSRKRFSCCAVRFTNCCNLLKNYQVSSVSGSCCCCFSSHSHRTMYPRWCPRQSDDWLATRSVQLPCGKLPAFFASLLLINY